VSLRFLVDTNVLSEPARRRPHPGVLAALSTHAATVAVAAPSWHELWFGCASLPASARRDRLTAYLERGIRESFPILPYDAAAAELHGTLRARLAAVGRTPPFVDGQIAAIALRHNLTLITRNVSDFEGFDGLSVEDWAR
jgi:tRNA(fMet)-specific endonuclease VapC